MTQKQKRSLLQIIFGRKPEQQTGYTLLQMLNGYSPVFSSWGSEPYQSAAVREAVDAVARNAAKLKPKHIRRVGKNITPVDGQVERTLAIRPNPNMSTYDFLYKMVTTLMIDNNAFAYPVWNGMTLEALWPINCTRAEFLEDKAKTMFVRFWFGGGQGIILPYSEVIHLRRHFYKNDVLGENNDPINGPLEAIHTTNEGLGQAVKTSVNLRGIIQYQGILKDSDIKANRDRFVSEYMTVNNEGGVAALDSKATYKELTSEPKMIDAKQMKELRDNVYRYFGVNENIIAGSYNEDQWNAFYEGTIEPLAVQMSLEFTFKLFTARERGRGNEIMFEANRLQYASARTKIALIQNMMPMGLFTINEAREIFNQAPVEDGDKRLISLNYIDAAKANQYQLGKLGEEDDLFEEPKPGPDPDSEEGGEGA